MAQVEIVTSPSEIVPIDSLSQHPDNPNEGDVNAIAESMRLNGVVGSVVAQRSTGWILGGNHTWEAARLLGRDTISVEWIDCDALRAYAILMALNRTRDLAIWDDAKRDEILRKLGEADMLADAGFDEWDPAAGLDLDRGPSFGGEPGGEGGGSRPAPGPSLAERFLIPPFSVLDSRQGYWLARKREWIALGIHSELGRPQNLLKMSDTVLANGRPNGSKPSDSGNDPAFYWKKQETEERIGRELSTAEFLADFYQGPDTYRAGTSIFDPVLAEVVYRWWCPPAGRVLDPFAGGSVRGIVASRLGLAYEGIDLSAEQLAANEEQAHLAGDPAPRWICGDARAAASLVEGPFDLLFSCPPYFDLERYSDDPADLSNASSWDDFAAAYTAMVAAAAGLLADDRFAVFVVGNVRDRRGALLDLAALTADAFGQAGLSFYNDAVLISPVGSLPLRAARVFALRKLGRTHQQILVFLKGDAKRAAAALGPMEVPEELLALLDAATPPGEGDGLAL